MLQLLLTLSGFKKLANATQVDVIKLAQGRNIMQMDAKSRHQHVTVLFMSDLTEKQETISCMSTQTVVA